MEIDKTSFTAHPEREDWFVSQLEGDSTELEKKALAINDRGGARGYFAIYGCLPGDGRHRLYLAPEQDPVQVVRDFEVGAHGDEHQEAVEQIAMIQEQNPILPFFADSAGFKFKFRKPITEEFLHFLEATLSVGIDEPMMNEDGQLNERETGFVHLWWD